MKRERDPTPEEFEKLLAWLDSDRDEAGRKLILIQSRLIRIFVSRGCVDAESLADEVINRVAVRIDMVKVNYGDPLRCFLGFIDNVHREYLRDERKKSEMKDPPRPPEDDEREKKDRCLAQCLENLDPPDRDLFVRYFQGEKRARIEGRKKLAVELHRTTNALRIRAFHVRKKLRQCMVTCLRES